MKFLLYQVLQEQAHNQGLILNSLNTNNNRSVSNRIQETAKPDLVLNFESTTEPLQVVNIKDFIAQNKKIRIENISVFINPYVDQDSSYGLPDEFDVLKLFNNKTISTNFLSIAGTFNTSMYTSKENTGNTHKLYFRVLTDVPLVKIVIEYFLTNIDKILMEVSINCSIYILKYLLRKKLLIPEFEQNLIDLSSQKPFKNDDIMGNLIGSPGDITNTMRLNNSQINYPTTAQNKDESLNASGISDLNNPHFNNNNNLNNSKNFNSKILKFQLIRKGQRRCSIGIDFSFNILKDIKKIDFCEDAPSFREASDGLNVFCYCKNKSCKIFDEMFVVNKGSGRFDLLKEISFMKCPRCNSNKIEARNLGFINCEWSYRGYLTNKKNCCTSGDGLTIDDKLYVLNEINLNQHIEKLDILVKERIYVPPIAEKHNLNGEIDSDGNIDYDSIGLESIRSCHFKETKIEANNKNISNKEDYIVNDFSNFKNKNMNNQGNEGKNKVNSAIIFDSKFKSKIDNINNDNNNNNKSNNANNIQFNSSKNVTYNNSNIISKFGANNNNLKIESKNKNSITSNPSTDINVNEVNNSNDKKEILNSNENLNLARAKTQDLEIITEKQSKFEFGNCISFFSGSNIDKKCHSKNNIEANDSNKLEKNKTMNFSTSENKIENNDRCIMF